ncbi:hypothetical protein RKD19_002731 [Streptomyces canus]
MRIVIIDDEKNEREYITETTETHFALLEASCALKLMAFETATGEARDSRGFKQEVLENFDIAKRFFEGEVKFKDCRPGNHQCDWK